MTEEEEVVEYSKIKKLAKLQVAILKYLDDEKIQENDFSIKKLFDDIKIQKNEFDVKEILHLLLSIANNHHRNSNFYTKIDKILNYIKEDIKQTFSNSELLECISSNHRILLFFIENKTIEIGETILSKLAKPEHINYFFPEIDSYYIGQPLNLDEYNQENYKNYEKNRKLGENEDMICEMIRNDSVEEFIKYVNKNGMKLNSKINQSNFETNEFLIERETSFIEYAAFFGSIQIFQYLKINNVQLTESLWLYAIHSNKPELIHLLEDDHIEPIDKTYKQCISEAIKCHHNDIVNYLITNKNQNEFLLLDYVKYDNYDRLISDSAFFSQNHLKLQYVYDLLEKYPKIVDLLIRESYLNVNFIKIVCKLIFIKIINNFIL